MGWMSPNDLNDNPKRFLDIPHEMHKVLLEFQEKLFPGFKARLEKQKVHCLECEGEKPFEVVVIATSEETICDGYIGDKGSVEFLHTVGKGD